MGNRVGRQAAAGVEVAGPRVTLCPRRCSCATRRLVS
ncbi:MAG: hypothetical protein QOC56_636, partial [Alphaproteobacteria bacterium]|nr:hypothetical protein [Alphaproteobacteria bacterium]